MSFPSFSSTERGDLFDTLQAALTNSFSESSIANRKTLFDYLDAAVATDPEIQTLLDAAIKSDPKVRVALMDIALQQMSISPSSNAQKNSSASGKTKSAEDLVAIDRAEVPSTLKVLKADDIMRRNQDIDEPMFEWQIPPAWILFISHRWMSSLDVICPSRS
ncbi:hypothetical protein LTR47_012027 [Exophiala xenobiotica]|nr:hypothetical protein LTR92_011593 [Exophiala xenobiotica]KAK5201745.1 hypothetical protein LTR41_012109 [Exophiala xenobiotica]KAK5215277.1 hypothetical protein LTR47_012027 [Exophiala xenobiotica]KAK5240428.1 hypothetical protein LTS06_012460 [Exophiala xenobiotica]KAK5276334.1 hypothetical protein LTR40_011757 [Exophiala xenobiotica]